MPRVSNSVPTGITSDLAAECDLKAFYDRNYFFTIFLPSTEAFLHRFFSLFPWGEKTFYPKNLIFTTCFTARLFHCFSSFVWNLHALQNVHLLRDPRCVSEWVLKIKFATRETKKLKKKFLAWMDDLKSSVTFWGEEKEKDGILKFNAFVLRFWINDFAFLFIFCILICWWLESLCMPSSTEPKIQWIVCLKGL